MITKKYTKITQEVSQKQIWSLMYDINNWKSWDKSIEFSTIEGDFKSNSTFILKPKGGPNVKIYIEEVKPDFYFKDVTNFFLAKMYDEHWYEETAEGLRITSKRTMTGLFSKIWYKLVMKNMVDNIESEIDNQIENAKFK